MTTCPTQQLEVGTVLPGLVLPPLQRQTFADYAQASSDYSAIHLDAEVARAAGFPDVFAQGMLVMAYLGRAVTDWATLQRLRAFSARFVAVTHLGNQLTCRGTVMELFEQDGERRARLDLVVVDQSGEVKLRGSAVISLE
jgi:acyl dehydratase